MSPGDACPICGDVMVRDVRFPTWPVVICPTCRHMTIY